MKAPDITKYPVWMRKEIFPTYPDKSILFDIQENEKALRHIYESYRLEPVKRILFMLVIETIRNKFRTYEMEKKIESLQNQINDLKGD
jgi:hypothetical protein